MRVFMPKVLLGEIIGNQIGKNAIFYVKKGLLFLQTTKFAVSAWIYDQKTPEHPQNRVSKIGVLLYQASLDSIYPVLL